MAEVIQVRIVCYLIDQSGYGIRKPPAMRKGISVHLRWSGVSYCVTVFNWGVSATAGGAKPNIHVCSEYSDIILFCLSSKLLLTNELLINKSKVAKKYMYTIPGSQLSLESKLAYPLQLTAIPSLKISPIITSLRAGGSLLSIYIHYTKNHFGALNGHQ